MQQINSSRYKVTTGEIVTVEVQATKTGNFVRLSLNGANVEPSSLNPLTFQFTASGAARGSDFAVVSCHFADEAPNDADYQLFLTGSSGGGRLTGPDIVKESAVFDRNLTFVSS